jgi:hypothetical protein
MSNKQNLIPLLLMLAVGIFAVGCDQISTVTEANAVSNTTAASNAAEGCCMESSGSCCCGAGSVAQQQAETEGCCGKCAEELAMIRQESGSCGDCSACAEGDSTNCKCAGEETVSTTANQDKGATETDSPQPADDAKVNSFIEDRDVFHFLLANKDKIKRTVKELDNGVETLTESTDPEIVSKLQEHVASMYRRVHDVRPIRMRDPLFREVFQHADQIKMQVENTEQGIKATETSTDEYVVKLIQAHARVVTGFVEKGFEEARKNHQPPKK